MNNAALETRTNNVSRIAAYPATRGVGFVDLPAQDEGYVPLAARVAFRIASAVATRKISPIAHAA